MLKGNAQNGDVFRATVLVLIAGEHCCLLWLLICVSAFGNVIKCCCVVWVLLKGDPHCSVTLPRVEYWSEVLSRPANRCIVFIISCYVAL